MNGIDLFREWRESEPKLHRLSLRNGIKPQCDDVFYNNHLSLDH